MYSIKLNMEREREREKERKTSKPKISTTPSPRLPVGPFAKITNLGPLPFAVAL
jgi:hypothetical protein